MSVMLVVMSPLNFDFSYLYLLFVSQATVLSILLITLGALKVSLLTCEFHLT